MQRVVAAAGRYAAAGLVWVRRATAPAVVVERHGMREQVDGGVEPAFRVRATQCACACTVRTGHVLVRRVEDVLQAARLAALLHVARRAHVARCRRAMAHLHLAMPVFCRLLLLLCAAARAAIPWTTALWLWGRFRRLPLHPTPRPADAMRAS